MLAIQFYTKELFYKLSIGAFGLLLVSCATEATFKLLPTEPKARVEKLFEQDLQICVAGKYYILAATQDYYYIPAGEMVILAARKFFVPTKDGFRICDAEFGFVAKENATYLADLNPQGDTCRFEVTQVDAHGKTIEKLDSNSVQHDCFYYGQSGSKKPIRTEYNDNNRSGLQ